jgi:hypothetical protein
MYGYIFQAVFCPVPPNLSFFTNQFYLLPSFDGFVLCFLQIKTGIAATMFLKAFGGLLLIITSSPGAFLLVGTLLLQPSCIMNLY